MTHRIPAAVLAAAALLTLVGCGGSGRTTATDPATAVTSASAPSPTAQTEAQTEVQTEVQQPDPQWPADCGTRSSVAFDFAREPDGWRTPEDAVLHSQLGDIPTGTLQVAAQKPHTEQQVYVLDADGTILASVSVIQVPTGWIVDGLTTCA